MAQPGDGCPNCGGFYVVVNSIKTGLGTIQYVGCRGCGHRPWDNKLVDRRPAARLRRPKTSSNSKR